MELEHCISSLPFRPSPLQECRMLDSAREKVPKYLFRVSTPNSAGRTSTSIVQSDAVVHASPKSNVDIFDYGA